MATIATSACWGLVVLTWIAGALYWGRGSQRSRQGRARPLWAIVLVVAVVVALRLSWHDVGRLTDHSKWIELPGLVLLLVSTAFTIWARIRLGRMWSASPNMLQAAHELRTDGPYAITRHPIYTGILGMVVGTVLLNGLGSTLAALLFSAVFLATRIPVEERLMTRTFPEEYGCYRKRVPLLVPGLRLHRREH